MSPTRPIPFFFLPRLRCSPSAVRKLGNTAASSAHRRLSSPTDRGSAPTDSTRDGKECISTIRSGRLPTWLVQTDSNLGKRSTESEPMLSGYGLQATDLDPMRNRTSTAGRILVGLLVNRFAVTASATNHLCSA